MSQFIQSYALRKVGRVVFSAAFGCMLFGTYSFAAPQNGSISSGSGSISHGQNTVIDQHSAVLKLDWDSFNVLVNESVAFNQLDSSSIAINNIHDVNPSQIDGSIFANGRIVLRNDAGITFGETAYVNVGSLIATTSNYQLNGDSLQLLEATKDSKIKNLGRIDIANNGFAILHAPKVEISGQINAQNADVHVNTGGFMEINFGSGQISVDAHAATENALERGIDLTGQINNAGGAVVMTAQQTADTLASMINLDGAIDVSGDGTGSIDVFSQGHLDVQENAVLKADGGDVLAIAKETAVFRDGAKIENLGGFVEVSGYNRLHILGSDISAETILFDPRDITIASGGGAAYADVDLFSDNAGLDFTIAAATLEALGGNVNLEATRDIFINESIALTNSGQSLNIEAGDNISVASGVAITTNNGNVTLSADYNFGSGADGVGGITMDTGSSINAGSGEIYLNAAEDIYITSLTTTSASAQAVRLYSTNGSLNGTNVGGDGTINVSAVNGTLEGVSNGMLNMGAHVGDYNMNLRAGAISLEDFTGNAILGITNDSDQDISIYHHGSYTLDYFVGRANANLLFHVKGGDLTLDESADTNGGNISLFADGDIIMTDNANITSTGGGNITITADADASGAGSITMSSLAAVDAAGGEITFNAFGDITLANLTTTSASANAVVVTSSGGSIIDGNGSATTDITALNGGVILNAANNIGQDHTNWSIDVLANRITATATTGNLRINQRDSITVFGDLTAAGRIYLDAWDTLNLDGNITSTGGKLELFSKNDVILTANANLNAATTIDIAADFNASWSTAQDGVGEVIINNGAQLTSGTSIHISSSEKVTFDGQSNSSSLSIVSSGDIDINANANIIVTGDTVIEADSAYGGNHSSGYLSGYGSDTVGAITIADGASVNSGAGKISLTAAEDITLTGLLSTSADSDAITVTSTGGMILDGGITTADIIAHNGGIILTSASHLGGPSGSHNFIDLEASNIVVNVTSGYVYLVNNLANGRFDEIHTANGNIALRSNTGATYLGNVSGGWWLQVESAGPLTADGVIASSGINLYSDNDLIIESTANLTGRFVRLASDLATYRTGEDGVGNLYINNGSYIESTAGDLILSSGENITIDSDIISSSSDILYIRALGDITFGANAQVQSADAFITADSQYGGSINETGAHNLGSDNVGAIFMNSTATINSGAGKADFTAAGNITVSSITSTNVDNDAISITSLNGSILDGSAAGAIDITALNGGILLTASTGIGVDNAGNETIEYNSLVLGASTATGTIRINKIGTSNTEITGLTTGDASNIYIEQEDAFGTDESTGSLTISGDISTAGGRIDIIQADSLDIQSTAHINSNGGLITIRTDMAPTDNNSIINIDGDITGGAYTVIRSVNDIVFGSTSHVDNGAGTLEIYADSTYSGLIANDGIGSLIVSNGAIIETSTGGITLSAGEDVNIDGQVISVSGAIKTRSGKDTNILSNAQITSTSGNVYLTADFSFTAPGLASDSIGAITMADGAIINSGSGKISLTAAENITLAGLTTTNAGDDAVVITSTAGNINDGSVNGTIDITALNGGVQLNAATGIGVNAGSSRLEISTNKVTAITTTGVIGLGSMGVSTLTLETIQTGNGEIDIRAQESLSVNLGTDTNSLIVNGDLLSGGGVISLRSTEDITLSSTANIDSSNASINLLADSLFVSSSENDGVGSLIVENGAQINAGTGYLTLSAGEDVILNDGATAGIAEIRAGNNVNFAHADADIITSGNIEVIADKDFSTVKAGAKISDGVGAIIMVDGATINATTEKIALTAAEDISIGYLTTSNADLDAINITSTNGDIINVGTNWRTVVATQGGVQLSANNVGLSPSLKIDSKYLTASITDTMYASVGGYTTLNDMTSAGGHIYINMIANGSIVVDGDIVTNGGNFKIESLDNVTIAANSNILTAGGNLTLRADHGSFGSANDGVGEISIGTDAVLNAGAGKVYLSAAEDLIMRGEVSTTNSADDSILINIGGLIDDLHFGSDFISSTGGAVITAGSIGSDTNDVEMTVKKITATVDSGHINMSLAGGTIVEDLTNTYAGGIIRLEREVSGNISIDGTLTTNAGDITIESVNDITLTGPSRINTTGGNLVMSADHDFGSGTDGIGEVSFTNGGEANVDGGKITITASEGLILGGLYSTSAADDAITINVGGDILDLHANSDVVASNGGINIVAGSIGGGANGAVEVEGEKLFLTANTGQIEINTNDTSVIKSLTNNSTADTIINRQQSGTIAIDGDITLAGGDLFIRSSDHITLSSISNITSNNGNVTLTADYLHSFGPGNNGVGAITMEDSSKIDAGSGRITLTAAEDIALTSLITTSSDVNAIDITSTNGAILDANSSYNIDAINGTVTLNAFNNIGDASNAYWGIDIKNAAVINATSTTGYIRFDNFNSSATFGDLTAFTDIHLMSDNSGSANIDGIFRAGNNIHIYAKGHVDIAATADLEATDNIYIASDYSGSWNTTQNGAGTLTVYNGARIQANNGDLLLSSGDDIILNSAIIQQGSGNVYLYAVDDIALWSNASISSTGNLMLEADTQKGGAVRGNETGTIVADGIGSITMASSSLINGGTGNVSLIASEDILLTGVRTDSSSTNAITITSANGNIFDNGNTNTDIYAANGGVIMNAAGKIGDGTGGNWGIDIRANRMTATANYIRFDGYDGNTTFGDLTSNTTISLVTSGGSTVLDGTVRAADLLDVYSANNTQLNATADIEADRIYLMSDFYAPWGPTQNGIGDITIANGARVHARTADLHLSSGNDITIDGDLSYAGSTQLSIFAKNDINLGTNASILSSRLVDLRADYAHGGATRPTSVISGAVSDGNGSITMVGGASIDAGASEISMLASEDIIMSNLVTTSSANNAVVITSTAGSILDGNASATEITALNGQVHLTAYDSIGQSSANYQVEIKAAEVYATATTGSIRFTPKDDLTVFKDLSATNGFIKIESTTNDVNVDGNIISGDAVQIDSEGSVNILSNSNISSGDSITIASDFAASWSTVQDGIGSILVENGAQISSDISRIFLSSGADLDIDGSITSSGQDVFLRAAGDITLNANADITTDGYVELVADHQYGGSLSVGINYGGQTPDGVGAITMVNGSVINSGAGQVQLLAAEGVQLSRVETTSSLNDAIIVRSTNAGITETVDTNTELSAINGGILLDAELNIGDDTTNYQIEFVASEITATSNSGFVRLHNRNDSAVYKDISASYTIKLESAYDINIDGNLTSANSYIQLHSRKNVDISGTSTIQSNLATRIAADFKAPWVSTQTGIYDVNIADGANILSITELVLLSASRDVNIGGTVRTLTNAEEIYAFAGRDINLTAAANIDTSNGNINLRADDIKGGSISTVTDALIAPDGDGAITMANGSTLNSGSGQIIMTAAEDITISSLTSNSFAVDAVSFTTSGAVRGTNVNANGDINITATSGGISANSNGFINIGFNSNAHALTANAGDIAIEQFNALAAGGMSNDSNYDYTLYIHGDYNDNILLNRNNANLFVKAIGGDITLNDSYVTAGGNFTLKADGDIVFGSSADIQTANGNFSLFADADNTAGGGIAMDHNVTVNAGNAKITLTATDDISISNIITTSNATDAVQVTSSAGSIVDAGTAHNINIMAANGHIILNAGVNVGETTVGSQYHVDVVGSRVHATADTGAVYLYGHSNSTVYGNLSAAGDLDLRQKDNYTLSLAGTMTVGGVTRIRTKGDVNFMSTASLVGDSNINIAADFNIGWSTVQDGIGSINVAAGSSIISNDSYVHLSASDNINVSGLLSSQHAVNGLVNIQAGNNINLLGSSNINANKVTIGADHQYGGAWAPGYLAGIGSDGFGEITMFNGATINATGDISLTAAENISVAKINATGAGALELRTDEQILSQNAVINATERTVVLDSNNGIGNISQSLKVNANEVDLTNTSGVVRIAADDNLNLTDSSVYGDRLRVTIGDGSPLLVQDTNKQRLRELYTRADDVLINGESPYEGLTAPVVDTSEQQQEIIEQTYVVSPKLPEVKKKILNTKVREFKIDCSSGDCTLVTQVINLENALDNSIQLQTSKVFNEVLVDKVVNLTDLSSLPNFTFGRPGFGIKRKN